MRMLGRLLFLTLLCVACGKAPGDGGSSSEDDQQQVGQVQGDMALKDLYVHLYATILKTSGMPDDQASATAKYLTDHFPQFPQNSGETNLLDAEEDAAFESSGTSFQAEIARILTFALRSYAPSEFEKYAPYVVVFSDHIFKILVAAGITNMEDLTAVIEQTKAANTVSEVLQRYKASTGQGLNLNAADLDPYRLGYVTGIVLDSGTEEVPSDMVPPSEGGSLTTLATPGAVDQNKLNATTEQTANLAGISNDAEKLNQFSNGAHSSASSSGTSQSALEHFGKKFEVDPPKKPAGMKSCNIPGNMCRFFIIGVGKAAHNGTFFFEPKLRCTDPILLKIDDLDGKLSKIIVKGLEGAAQSKGASYSYKPGVGTYSAGSQWVMPQGDLGDTFELPEGFSVEFPGEMFTDGKGPTDCSHTCPNLCAEVEQEYTVAGKVTNLHGKLVLQNNEQDDLTLSTTEAKDATFGFKTDIVEGGQYAVTIKTHPVGQVCTVENGSGTVSTTVTNVSITCMSNTYSVGGSITGHHGDVTVAVGDLSDTVSYSDSTFDLGELPAIANYTVAISAVPAGHSCKFSASNSTETTIENHSAAISNLNITCVDTSTYVLSGTASGITGSVTVTNSVSSEAVVITSNGAFTFADISWGDSYDLSVTAKPSGETCTVAGAASGDVTASVTNLTVTCAPNFELSGTVTGLTGTLIIRNNITLERLDLISNGAYEFTNITNGATYDIRILAQPDGQTCSFTGSLNDLHTADVTDVDFNCVTN